VEQILLNLRLKLVIDTEAVLKGAHAIVIEAFEFVDQVDHEGKELRVLGLMSLEELDSPIL